MGLSNVNCHTKPIIHIPITIRARMISTTRLSKSGLKRIEWSGSVTCLIVCYGTPMVWVECRSLIQWFVCFLTRLFTGHRDALLTVVSLTLVHTVQIIRILMKMVRLIIDPD